MKSYGIIYKVTNIINGKIYIGQTTKSLKNRKRRHIGRNDNLYFHRALNKYGKNSFKWEIICECENQDDLNEEEIYYIKKHNSYWKENGYNLSLGGDGNGGLYGEINGMYGKNHSKESIEKMKRNRHGKCMGDDNPMRRPEMIKWMKENNPMNNKESRDKIAEKLSKLWEITTPKGETLIIRNLSDYCKNNNLPYSSMRRNGKCKKGWKCKRHD